MKPHTSNQSQSSGRKSRRFTGSMFETLESRQMMSKTFMPILTGPIGLILQPIVVNGTPYGDFITVSYSNNPVLGSRIVVRVNPSNVNPGYVVFPQPGQGVQINGLGGNDVIRYSGSLGANIYGGEGNDTITGGSGADYLSGDGGHDVLDGGLGPDVMSGGEGTDTADYSTRTGNVTVTVETASNDGYVGENDNVMSDMEVVAGGSGNDNISFLPAAPTWHKLVGNGGNDTLVGSNGPDLMEDGPGDDSLVGNNGDDVLFASSGNDIVRGGFGGDLITGGRDQDLLFGDSGADTIWGDEGNDTMSGGWGGDILYGGKGNDILRGDGDNDLLLGQDDNDRLYGGQGADTANGGNGNDGLFGGNISRGGIVDVDELTGGAGHDRFLFQTGDVIKDLAATDARINFRDGQQVTVTFGGQNGSYTYAGRSWTDAEVENVDMALNALHEATGNTRLLKRSDRAELSFIRQGRLISSTGGTFSAAAWNGGGQISVVSISLGTIIHEIGHNWDTEFDSTGWNALSGWTLTDMTGNSNYQQGTGNDGWWHLRTAQFASTYARTNPVEDFAESFKVNILTRAALPNLDTVVAAKNTFVDNMLISLAANA